MSCLLIAAGRTTQMLVIKHFDGRQNNHFLVGKALVSKGHDDEYTPAHLYSPDAVFVAYGIVQKAWGLFQLGKHG